MKNKKIILGVTGSIAAYKCCELIRRLKERGADVFCVLTPDALKFITPLTLETLSQKTVYTDPSTGPLRSEASEASEKERKNTRIEHLDLARDADLVLIAPATANTINKLAWGIADNLLTSTVLATRAPVLVAPAMNAAMYNNPLTQENIARLKQICGFHFLGPEKGLLACGEEDIGRLIDVEKIAQAASETLEKKEKSKLKGKKVLITAGPTREYIDPLRFISNASSGKMGYYLAQEVKERGAVPILISGPTQIYPAPSGARVPAPEKVKTVFVESAQEMHRMVKKYFPRADLVISTAAVSDYRPHQTLREKIKKEVKNLRVELERNPDILKELGKRKKGKFLVGFALENEKSLHLAYQKLKEKNLDLLVANPPEAAGKEETRAYFLYPRSSRKKSFPRISKRNLAVKIVDEIEELI